MASPDAEHTPQFDTLYALAHAPRPAPEHIDADALQLDFVKVDRMLTRDMPDSALPKCAWCSDVIFSDYILLDCQRCTIKKPLCFDCFMSRQPADDKGDDIATQGLCELALEGCADCRANK